MSQKGFSLRNVLWGIFLGLTIVAGWILYPSFLTFFRSPAPEMPEKITARIQSRVEKEIRTSQHMPQLELVSKASRNIKRIEPYYAKEEALWQELLIKPFKQEDVDSFPYDQCFEDSASITNLPLSLVLGLAACLSNFDPRSFMDNRFGIMRLGWPDPSKGMGVSGKEELTDEPCQNIELACRFLSDLLKKSGGEWVPALVAYRDQVGVVRPEKIKREDLFFSARLRKHVEEVFQGPFEKKIMYAFWQFDERMTAEDFMESIRKRAGVDLWLGQESHKYVVYVPAADEEERNHKVELVNENAGIAGKLGVRSHVFLP